MRSGNATRRDALKAIGATAAAITVPATSAAGQTLSDNPYLYASQNVANKYDDINARQPISSLLSDNLGQFITSINYRYEYPNVSTANDLEDAHSQFENFLGTVDQRSGVTNVLVVDENEFGTGFEAGHPGGDATVVSGAEAFETYHQNEGDPGQFGTDTTYRQFQRAMMGVSLNHDVDWGSGLTYDDPTGNNNWARTPMAIIDSSDEWTTNDCGEDTYRTNEIATRDLHYSDCTLGKIEEYY